MEKLLEVADQQASSASSASDVADFDENLFHEFMNRNSVWNFHCISRGDYLHKSKADKEQLVLSYYRQMKNVEQIKFLISIVLWSVF